MPPPIRTGTFGRRFTPQEFQSRYRAELQMVADLKNQGVDTKALEQAIADTQTAHQAGRAIRDLDLRALVPSGRGPVTIPVNPPPGGGNAHVIFGNNRNGGQP